MSDALREAVRTSGVSQAEVARYTGIGPAGLSRFLSGQGGLSVGSLDVLAAALRVRLVTADEWERKERIWTLYKNGVLRRVAAPEVDSPVGGGTV
jgi:transcriptional regulator with XRE-family HTH domain